MFGRQNKAKSSIALRSSFNVKKVISIASEKNVTMSVVTTRKRSKQRENIRAAKGHLTNKGNLEVFEKRSLRV